MSYQVNKLNVNGSLTAYLGHLVSPINDNTYTDIEDGALVVDEAGSIVCVEKRSRIRATYGSDATVVDFGKCLILPGFVDLHLHLPQIPCTGRPGDGLLGWLNKYVFPAEARFADVVHARKIANWFFDELARNGTTLACVFTTIHAEATDIAFQVAAKRGNRVIMGKVLMDANSPSALTEDSKISLSQAEELCRKWHGHDDNRLLYAFTPRFAISCSQELLSGCGKLWQRLPGTYLHTHLAESEEEVAFVSKLFPHARSYLDVYSSYGLAGKNSIFAHGIHVDDKDIASLARGKASLAHCPGSNFFLKSGIFKYRQIREAGVCFGLGSDIAGGPQMSMFGVMKDAAYMQWHEWISVAELFYRATLGGAQALNLDGQVGSLEAGKQADFVVIDPTRRSLVPRDMQEHPTDEILSSLVYLGDDRSVVATFVRGRSIYQAPDCQIH